MYPFSLKNNIGKEWKELRLIMTALDFKFFVKLMKSNGSARKNCEDQGVVSDGN